jgi:hypothetical protein
MKNFQNKTNIVRVSKIVRNILFAGLVLWIITIPVVLFPAAVSLWSRLGVTPGSRYMQCALPLLMVFCLIINLKLFRFFDRLKNGHLFDAQTVGNLDGAGRWWVALWFFEILFYAIGHEFFQTTNAPHFGGGYSAGSTLSLFHGIGHEIFQMPSTADFSGSLFAGLTLIFVAWLLKEAQELQEEQALTV